MARHGRIIKTKLTNKKLVQHIRGQGVMLVNLAKMFEREPRRMREMIEFIEVRVKFREILPKTFSRRPRL